MSGEQKSGREPLSYAFVELHDGARAQRACARWALLAAVQRAAVARKNTAPASFPSRAGASTGAWWEE